ncbi:hypothetical protein HK100_010050, partial [Physocladia obscura]
RRATAPLALLGLHGLMPRGSVCLRRCKILLHVQRPVWKLVKVYGLIVMDVPKKWILGFCWI